MDEKLNEGTSLSHGLISNLDIRISRWFLNAGMWVLFLMGCLVALDVVTRFAFNKPVRGAWEIVELSLVVVVFCSAAYAYFQNIHVNVDILLNYFTDTTKRVLLNIDAMLGLGLFVCLVWYSFRDFLGKVDIGMESMILGLPHAPFALLVPVGCALLCLLLIRELVTSFKQASSSGLDKKTRLILVVAPVISVIAAVSWVFISLHLEMNPVATAVISLGVVFALIAIGMPIAFALFMGGILFLPGVVGVDTALTMAGRELFSTTGTANWAIMGLFTMMGYFIYHSRLGQDLFRMANNWLGFMPGGLAMATVGGSTAMAACAGGSMSSTIVMGTVAYPEMKKYGYSENLSTGVICSGATLGPLIPPSIPFVFYGLLTKQSIGKLFIAGIIPGILLAIAFLITIYVWCKINPSAGKGIPPSTWPERLSSALMVIPVLVLFFLVIGGIYTGIFTPTEAGGVAAFTAFAISLIMGRLNLKIMVNAIRDSALMTCAIMLMIAGGKVYAYVIIASGLGDQMANLITGFNATPNMVAAIFLIIYLVMGCFFDVVAILLITTPILIPVAMAANLDLIWFGVLATIVCNLGLITPPFGANLFLLKMINRDISMSHIYRGVIPFVISTLVLVVIIFLYPPLATWLPDLLRG